MLTAEQFIALGGIIGIGFFRGSSKSLAIVGPVGALIAVVVVGIVATAVMECICELIVLWPSAGMWCGVLWCGVTICNGLELTHHIHID